MADNTEEQSASLQDLFASLRSSSNRSNEQSAVRHQSAVPASQQPYTFQFTSSTNQKRYSEPPQQNPQSIDILQSFNGYPQRGSGGLSPDVPRPMSFTPSPADQPAVDRTANLLSLLKFNQPTSSQNPPLQQSQSQLAGADQYILQTTPEPVAQHTHGRGLSASDLVASFMGRPSSSLSRETMAPSTPATQAVGDPVTAATAKPQDYLLQLLNRSKTTAVPVSAPANFTQESSEHLRITNPVNKPLQRGPAAASTQDDHKAQAAHSESAWNVRTESPIRVFGSSDIKETTPFAPEHMPKAEPPKEPLFTYVNPFDQLAASSPRISQSRSGDATPQRSGLNISIGHSSHAEGGKRKSTESSPARSSSVSRRKLTPRGSDILQSIENPVPAQQDNGKSPLADLNRIGAPTTDPETVAEALNDVGAQVSKQADHALEQASKVEEDIKVKEEENEIEQTAVIDALEEHLRDMAIEVKGELDKEENEVLLAETMPQSIAEAVKEIIDETAAADFPGGRGSADDEKSSIEASYSTPIAVYSFPMKPFVSINIKQNQVCTQYLREDAIMEIARLKKEFDQIDRTLATASSNFILYAMPKSGGLRVIRQEDGLDRQVFRETHDRIFNVAISKATPGTPLQDVQTFIATAVSGTVYWATICHAGSDIIQEENLEFSSLIFPPIPTHDENTSGGQLKTRAKKSSRHPDFFAIGRGKSIQIVFPGHARNSSFVSSSAVVNTEGYFKERSLKISTGKAGKDFTFSEDDTMMTTLDKTGRLRFWDIRELTHEANGTASKIAPIEAKTPVLSFATAVAGEKSWPTSVMFVDKIRAYSKCVALRYIIVGMKQNHTLQLWDLGLGKAVQELSFPHQKESDAICSVCYHPGSGIIVVGHPTRNSIYFIHLSAPKYGLPVMSQARFIQRLADRDPNLPKTEATAIMSGLREFSFSTKGQLRSIELLPVSGDSAKDTNNDGGPILFELYVMHSKGVTCLNIKKEDLGWSQNAKIMNAINAEAVGLVEVQDLRERQQTVLSERSSVNGDTTSGSAVHSEAPRKSNSKESPKTDSILGAGTKPSDSRDAAAAGETPLLADSMANGSARNGVDKAEKKKKKRAVVASGEPSEGKAGLPASAVPGSYAAAASRTRSPSVQDVSNPSKLAKRLPPSKSASADIVELGSVVQEQQSHRSLPNADSISLGISGDFLDRELKKLEKIVSDEFSNVLGKELGILYRRIDGDKRVQDAAGAAKQDAILRLVSSTLTENVEKALSRIVIGSIQQIVLPSIAEITASTLHETIPTYLTQQLLQTLPAQLKLALPEALTKAIQSPDVLRVLADQVTAKIGTHVERQFTTVLHQAIVPAFQNLAVGAAQKMSIETERRVSEQLKQVEKQHREDVAKIDQLTASVRALMDTVHAMAAAQTGFQNEILTLQRRSLEHRRASTSRGISRQPNDTAVAQIEAPQPPVSFEQQQFNQIADLFNQRHSEEATLQWLQSNQQDYLFDNLIRRYDPSYLQGCQSLLVLSVGAAVTSSFVTFPEDRLHWLETALHAVNPNESEISGVGGKIMTVLIQRLEGEFMNRAEVNKDDPLLPKIPPVVRLAREFLAAGNWKDHETP